MWYLTSRVIRSALLLLMGGEVVIVFLQVLFRYLFRSPLTWSEELSRFLLLWITFLGAVPAVECGGHVAIESVVARVGRYKPVFTRVILIFELFFAVILVYSGTMLVITAWTQISPAIGLPMGAVYAVIPLSGLLLAVVWSRRLLGMPPVFSETMTATGAKTGEHGEGTGWLRS